MSTLELTNWIILLKWMFFNKCYTMLLCWEWKWYFIFCCWFFFCNIDIPRLFVCLFGVFRHTWNFFTHMETSLTANFDLCLALSAIKQWGSLHVPHLLLHGTSVYNSHLLRPVTLTPIAERMAMVLSPPVFTRSIATGIRTPNLQLAGRTIKPTAPPPRVYPLIEK